jgi:hypothetical protein
VVPGEMEEREEMYQCWWVGKIEGLVSCWTWKMKVLGCSFVEEEVERERRQRRQRRESIVIENRRVFELCY